ncbi:MAG: hypothetical protein WD795_02155 [Woeseia sp.]
MKLNTRRHRLAALVVAAMAFSPAAVVAETTALAAKARSADAEQALESSVTLLQKLRREWAERERVEAARVADAVRSAAKLDLDIRLAGPISIVGGL